MHKWSKPGPAIKLCRKIRPYIQMVTIVVFLIGLYYALANSPADYQQGDAMRIMYVHVPSAWMAMGVYSFMAVISFFVLIWRHILAEILLKAAIPIGTMFTFLSLVTGSIWGKPMWGTWWVWDARLTSVLILFFIYLGIMMLYNSFDDPSKGSRIAALFTLIGAINLPIIKFSVEWWNTLHQPASVMKLSGPSIHGSMLTPLLIMALAYALFFITIMTYRVEICALSRKINIKGD